MSLSAMMPDTITITLPFDLKSALDEATRQEGVPAEELIRDALKAYFFMRQLNPLRERMIAQAQTQSIYTDEDIFALVS